MTRTLIPSSDVLLLTMFWMVLRSSEPGVAGTNMVASAGLYQDDLASSFFLSLSSQFHSQGW